MQVSGCLHQARKRKDASSAPEPEGQRLRRSEINAIQVLNHNANCLHELRDGPMMKA